MRPTPSTLLASSSPASRVVDLGRPLRVGMPQSPNHPAYWHALPRRHGDMVRADGGSAANDMITMGTHVGTHIDALAHVSQDGKLYGGLDADDAGGRAVRRAGRAHDRADGAPRRAARRPGDARCRAAVRPATRSPSPTSRRHCRARTSTIRVRRRRAGPHRLGPALRRRRRRRSAAARSGVPGVGEAGAHLAGRPRRPRRRRGHDRLRAARARRGPRAAAGPPGAARRARHLHRRDDGPRGAGRAGVPRVPVRPVAAEALRRHRLAGPTAGGGRRDDRADARPAARRLRRRYAVRTACPTTSRQRAAAGPRHPRPRASPRTAWRPAPRAARPRPRPGRAAAGRRRWASERRSPANQAALVNGVLAHSLDYDDTHLPSVLHPSASVVPAALAAAEHAGARRRAARPRDRGRARGRRTPRHGRLRRAARQLGLLRARPARHLDRGAMGGAVVAASCYGGDGRGRSTRSA